MNVTAVWQLTFVGESDVIFPRVAVIFREKLGYPRVTRTVWMAAGVTRSWNTQARTHAHTDRQTDKRTHVRTHTQTRSLARTHAHTPLARTHVPDMERKAQVSDSVNPSQWDIDRIGLLVILTRLALHSTSGSMTRPVRKIVEHK